VTDHDAPYTAPTVDIDYGKLRRVALLSAVVGLGAWFALGLVNLAHDNGRDFFLSYLVGWVFWLSLPIGSFALLSLGYTTSASWALVVRRIFQASTRTLPLMALLSIPIIVGMFLGELSPYWWTRDVHELTTVPEAIAEQEHRQHLYLNVPRFLIMQGIIFGIFWLFIRGLERNAPASEDQGDTAAWGRVRNLAAPGVVVWAILSTFVATDWIMSVEMSWASTMFPVVHAMDQFTTAFGFAVFLFYTLVGKNETILTIVKPKFRIDIGSLTLGFAMVWAYASFSQFMLIWAGNLPEEIGYYRKRLHGGWEYLAYFLAIFHWLVPFIVLLFREVKVVPDRMRWMTGILMVACAADVLWWIVPAYPHTGWLHVPMAIAALVGVGGVWGLGFVGELKKRNLLPGKETEFLATWGQHH
jgi:hypothetical protein